MSKLISNVALSRHCSFLSSSSSSSRAIHPLHQFAHTRHFLAPRVFSSSSSVNHSKLKMEAEHYKFGPYKIDPSEVFFSTKFSYALVNLRPLVPGNG
ncbi:unnamed protein product [Cuscuta campestris]|uniref:Uncharacterized protein n=1 Tax=Cuscuta campestris TaxID=132261 RepID=A0A484L5X2_9ASTE|nr:unnamed protein product [Cuscuta campestris]